MKTLRHLTLIIVLALIAIPLVIAAQDNSTGNDDDLFVPIPPNTNDDDLFVPIPPNTDDDDLFVPIPPNTEDDDLIVPLTEEDSTLVIGTANPCWDCIEYPDHGPTVTPRPQVTAQTQSPAIVNGLWIQEPGGTGFSSSGQCLADYGDNDGPPNYGSEEEIPRVPACISGDNQWLSVNSNGPFPRVLDGVYSTQEMSRNLLEINGETSGSVNVTTRREYRIISPTVVEFSYTTQEDGGCTRTSTIRYRMVEPNDMVCSGTLITPDATLQSTPVSTAMATPQAGETPAPVPTVVPPVTPGGYVITLPPVDDSCAADQMPPADTVAVTYDNNQNMFIDFGGGSYTLFWDGDDYYQYRKGNRFMVSVITYDGGASLNWSNNGCFVSSPLSLEGAPTATPVPVEPTSESYTDVGAIAGNSYNTTWDAPEYLCAAENQPLLPDLNSGVLTAQADGNFLFTLGGTDYILTNTDGIHGFVEMGADGSMLSIGMNGFYEGTGAGTFSVITSDGKVCIAQLTFKPQ